MYIEYALCATKFSITRCSKKTYSGSLDIDLGGQHKSKERCMLNSLFHKKFIKYEF